MTIFVGLDWGGSSHAVCIVAAAGKILDQFSVTHDRAGLADLVARLRRHGLPGETRVAIERPSGLLVDVLVEAGFVVTPVHPNVVKACRPRYRAAAAKSDPGDAYILADILRTDGHRLAPLRPQSDAIKALRALVRGRDDLVATRLVFANQLRALLESFWLVPSACSPTSQAPSLAISATRPESASRLAESAWPPSSPTTSIAAGAASPICSDGSAPLPAQPPRKPRPTPRANSRAPLPALSKASSSRSPSSPAASSMPLLNCRKGSSSCRFRAPEKSAPPRSPPSWATCATASRARITSPPKPASLPSHTRAVDPVASAGDGPATSVSAPPSPASPTTRAMQAHGPRKSINTPEVEDAGTHTPSESSPEHGCASSGEHGTTACHTIPKNTQPLAPCSCLVDTGSLMRPSPAGVA